MSEEFEISKNKPTHGGVRPNSGRKPGGMNKKTKEQKVVEEEFRQRVLRSMDGLINSQMNLAQGCQFLFVIKTIKYKDKETGSYKTERKKPEIVENPNTIASYLEGDLDDDDSEYYFMTTQKPDNRSLDSLIDRVFGKPAQSLDVKVTERKLLLD